MKYTQIRSEFGRNRIICHFSGSISQRAQGYDFTMNTRSKDILLPTWKISDVLIKAIIHRSDTISIVIGCSLLTELVDIDATFGESIKASL